MPFKNPSLRQDPTNDASYLMSYSTNSGCHFRLDKTVNNRNFRRPDMPPGNRSPDKKMAPHNSYQCLGEDKWWVISISTESQWKSFVEVMGNPLWASKEQFRSMESRFENQDELDANIKNWTKTLTNYDLNAPS